MNRESTRKRRVQKTLGLHYSRFYVIALCIDSRFRHKILENCSQAAPVEKVGLNVGQQSLIRGSSRMTLLRLGLPLSRWRASKAHSTREGSPALSRPQRRIPRRG